MSLHHFVLDELATSSIRVKRFRIQSVFFFKSKGKHAVDSIDHAFQRCDELKSESFVSLYVLGHLLDAGATMRQLDTP